MVSSSSVAVRGTALIGIVKQLTAGGGQTLQTVVAEMAPEHRVVFDERLRKTSWYPYPVFTELLCAVDRVRGRGDLAYCRVVGDRSAQLDLGSVFRVFASIASPEHLIRGCGRVWTKYYRDAGTMTATAWSPELTVLRIDGFPGMHPAHCRLMEGWMIAAMRIIGAMVGPGASETRCCSRGDDAHEFSCSWRRETGRSRTGEAARMSEKSP